MRLVVVGFVNILNRKLGDHAKNAPVLISGFGMVGDIEEDIACELADRTTSVLAAATNSSHRAQRDVKH